MHKPRPLQRALLLGNDAQYSSCAHDLTDSHSKPEKQEGRAGDPHFTNVDTEIGNGYVSCPGLQRGLGANLKLGDRCVLLWGHPLSSMGSFLDSCWKLKPQRGDECSNPDDLI